MTRCFAFTPRRRPVERFEAAAAHLDAMLPGRGPLHPRLAAEDAAWTIPPDRVQGVVEALVPRYRERAAALYGLPAGEDLRVTLVRDQPWTGYNWYDGGYRSRVDINLDLPLRLPGARRRHGARDVPGPPPRARAQGAGRLSRGSAGSRRACC